MCRRMLFRLLTWAMHTLEHSSVLLLGASLPDVHPWNLQQEALCISDNLQRGQAISQEHHHGRKLARMAQQNAIARVPLARRYMAASSLISWRQ